MKTAQIYDKYNPHLFLSATAKVTVLLSIVFLASCVPPGGREFAEQVFEDIQISRVLAFKKTFRSFSSAYPNQSTGCTFVVVRIAADSPQTPPNIRLVGTGYSRNFAELGAWRPTPVPSNIDLQNRAMCLTGIADFPYKPDGIGIDGYGEEIWNILQNPGAWFSIHGSGEHQVMHVYAPEERIAVRLRYGD